MKKHLRKKGYESTKSRKRFDCLLVNPPLCSCGCYEKTIAPLIPTRLISLATSLRTDGFAANVLDLAIMRDAHAVFEEMLAELRPAYVGFSNHTVIHLDVIDQLANKAKQNGSTVLLGGVNPTHMKRETFYFVPSADHLFFGFSEKSLSCFMKLPSKKRMIGSRKADFSNQVADIRILPHLNHYTSGLYPIETQRGCEFNCAFCNSKMMLGTRPARKPVELVIKEIKAGREAGFDEFFITDNTFTGDKKYVIELCKAISRDRIEARFIAMTRFDCVDEELIACMQRAGIRSIGFGFESASPKLLHRYRKDLNHQKTRQILAQTIGHGIETTAFVMVGGPGDTEETLAATHEMIEGFMSEGILEYVTASLFRPFPGTAYWNNPGRFGLSFEKSYSAFHDWGFFNGIAVSATRKLTKERIEYWAAKFNSLNPKTPELQI
jgi:radical SAM superfamily enzyme YgiQ (UPF0313 family)